MEKYIQAFIKVCEKVFLEFCQTEVIPGRSFFVSKETHDQIWDITGIIGFSGEAAGAVAISMKNETAFKITKILTGNNNLRTDSDVNDAIGEIVNIIAGNVKKDFEEELRIKISLPSIVEGKAHVIIWPSEKTRIICIPFKIFSNEDMCLSVAADPEK